MRTGRPCRATGEAQQSRAAEPQSESRAPRVLGFVLIRVVHREMASRPGVSASGGFFLPPFVPVVMFVRGCQRMRTGKVAVLMFSMTSAREVSFAQVRKSSLSLRQ